MAIPNYKKILIIRLSSLGDILLTSPVIRTLKSKYPNVIIDFIVRKEFEDTIKYNPNISNLISLSKDYNPSQISEEIYRANYDLIIDLQNNLRSRRITSKSKAKLVRYKKPYLKRLLLVKFNLNTYKNIMSIPDRYANALPEFSLDDKGIELFLPDQEAEKFKYTENLIGFCPGSQHKTKMWPKEYFVELGNKLSNIGFKVALLGGKSDKLICEELSREIPGSIDCSNDNKLLELASVMKQCNAIVCNDSGLMHTAIAVNAPVVAIFGSTVKELGFFPYKGKSIVLENNSLSCRPCSHIGLDKCPKKHLDCLKKITPKAVFENIIEFLA